MSEREWKPGDVAAVTHTDGRESRMMMQDDGKWACGMAGHGAYSHTLALDPDGDPIRPLVVIDPEDREQAERLMSAYWGHLCAGRRPEQTTAPEQDDAMQAALRSLITPPKPPEPTGLGAVVEDAKGRRWVRCEPDGGIAKWLLSEAPDATDPRYAWSAVPAVKVLSEGVQP